MPKMSPIRVLKHWPVSWLFSINKNISKVCFSKYAVVLWNFYLYFLFIQVGNALVMLLQNPDLLPSPSQRLAAVLLLHELFKQDTQTFHPFTSIFVHLLVIFIQFFLIKDFFKTLSHIFVISE